MVYIEAKQKFCKILDFANRHGVPGMGIPHISIDPLWMWVRIYWSFRNWSAQIELKDDLVSWAVNELSNEYYGEKIDNGVIHWRRDSEKFKAAILKVIGND